ncbi:hypothetical protein KCT17_003697 [Escherichia coli]|nr:hypothetical protein [Escherichia coli]
MGFGLQITPDSNWPAISLDASVRVPQYCGDFAAKYDANFKQIGNPLVVGGAWVPIPNYVAGSEVVTLADSLGGMGLNLGMSGDKRPTYWRNFSGGIEVSGGNIRAIKPAGGSWATIQNCRVFQLLPVGTNNFGLRIFDSNSTNMMAISNLGNCLRPIWKSKQIVNGKFLAPTVAGYGDKSKYIIFARTNNPNVGISMNLGLGILPPSGFDWGAGFSVLTINNNEQYNMQGTSASAEFEIVIFYPVAPERSAAGLNILDASGRITFSTKHTPFILNGWLSIGTNKSAWYTPSYFGGVAASRPMIPVTYGGFEFKANDRQRHIGIRSNGSGFTFTSVASGYTTAGEAAANVYNTSRFPVIDAKNYFG